MCYISSTTVPTCGPETVTQSSHRYLNSVGSTSLIPIKLGTANLPMSGAPTSHPIGMYLGMVQTPVLPNVSGLVSKPTIYLTPSVLSLTQATDLLCQTVPTVASAGAATTPTVSITNPTGASVTDPGQLFAQSNSFGPESQTVPASGSFHSGQNALQSTQLSCTPSDHLSSGELPSLSQIENMWLRIRELRRTLAKARESAASSIAEGAESGQVAAEIKQLESEHERLATLFRLVIIERIDALESQDSGVYTSSSDGLNANPSSSSADLQLELNLMCSYLRKLGGGTVTLENGPTSCFRVRRASSPLLDAKADTGYNHLTRAPSCISGPIHVTISGPLTSTPRVVPFLSHGSPSGDEAFLSGSWLNGTHTAPLSRNRSSPMQHHLSGEGIQMDDLLTPG
ncbi:unnamed protein product [Echinostoma caproni]|uniref:Ig-like domain-containing protein n=1 Tax=Echinostoma caproni TaxID=27848 RepID=A0A183AGM2_9TREM|nr:unnamed protein product [Echinostoma caproni]